MGKADRRARAGVRHQHRGGLPAAQSDEAQERTETASAAKASTKMAKKISRDEHKRLLKEAIAKTREEVTAMLPDHREKYDKMVAMLNKLPGRQPRASGARGGCSARAGGGALPTGRDVTVNTGYWSDRQTPDNLQDRNPTAQNKFKCSQESSSD